jgi:hypothetical protein
VSDAVAYVLALVLAGVALLHAHWASGGLWPAASEPELIRQVFGDARRHLPPAWTIWTVAGLIGITGAWPLLLASGAAAPLPGHVASVIGAVIGLIFLARGGAGYLPAWRSAHPLQPFATLDMALYSPLCIAIGAGYGYLVARSFA